MQHLYVRFWPTPGMRLIRKKPKFYYLGMRQGDKPETSKREKCVCKHGIDTHLTLGFGALLVYRRCRNCDVHCIRGDVGSYSEGTPEFANLTYLVLLGFLGFCPELTDELSAFCEEPLVRNGRSTNKAMYACGKLALIKSVVVAHLAQSIIVAPECWWSGICGSAAPPSKAHRDFPNACTTTELCCVSGVGADSIFMGVLRRYQVEPGIIRVWVMPSGAVVSVDDRFMDSFGKSYQDVAGRPLQTLTVDADAVIKLLDKAQAAPEEDFRMGKIAIRGVSFLHKYMDPVEGKPSRLHAHSYLWASVHMLQSLGRKLKPSWLSTSACPDRLPVCFLFARVPQVDITVDLGGSDSQRMLAFNLRPTKAAGKLMVTDARGRMLYINNDMREMLGYSVQVRAAALTCMQYCLNVRQGKAGCSVDCPCSLQAQPIQGPRSTPYPALCAVNMALSKLDISQLMPPPYNFLHGGWMKEPSAKKPKQSCRWVCCPKSKLVDLHVEYRSPS
eukprot:1012150-Pelagomonas_calceolata.AAC.13